MIHYSAGADTIFLICFEKEGLAQKKWSQSNCMFIQFVTCKHTRIEVYLTALSLFSSPAELKALVSFLIAFRSSSVRLSVSVRPSVNFSYFRLLLKNHYANFNQTWHKASLGEGDSSLFKWRAPPFSKGRNSENTLTKLKNLLLNHWANFNQTWHKASLGEWDSILFKEEPFNSHKDNNGFFSSLKWYNHMCLLIWTVFSDERRDPWASCLSFVFFWLWFQIFLCYIQKGSCWLQPL